MKFNIFKKLKFGLLALLLLPTIITCFVDANVNLGGKRDLMGEIFYPAQNELQTTIQMGDNVGTVGRKVLQGEYEIDWELKQLTRQKKPSIIIRFIRLFLAVVIALSVTMILYNGMNYIIQTGQGKDSKDLVKNLVYIVVGILISLFSVVIIRLIQSIPTTLNQELIEDRDNRQDQDLINDEYLRKAGETNYNE